MGSGEAWCRFDDISASITDRSPGTTISVGLSQVSPGEHIIEALRRADADLYQRRHDRDVPFARSGGAAHPSAPSESTASEAAVSSIAD